MCLAIPGKILTEYQQAGLRMAKIQFGGVTREACLEYLPQAHIGDYVLVHVGFAISRIDEAEARRTYELLQEMDQLTEVDAAGIDEVSPSGSD